MRRSALIVIPVACALLLAACGGKTVSPAPQTVVGTVPTTPAGPQGDATAGKAVFASAGCTGCHTLKDAGATGTVGPNLDEKKPPLSLVIDRVTHGKGAMPAFGDNGSLTPKQIADVAAYVVKATSGG